MKDRIEEARKELEMSGLGALLISTPVYLKYLTGFADFNDKINACLITEEKAHLIISIRDKEEALRVIKSSGAKVELFAVEIWSNRWQDIRAANLIKPGVKIGLEAVSTYKDVESIRKIFPDNQIVVLEELLVSELAAVKDSEETALIRRAVQITDDVLAKVIGFVRPGISELDLAAEVIYWHRKFGAEDDSFSPIIKSGPNSASCHGEATSRKIQPGDILQFDIGGVYNGYCSDLSRVFIVGKEPNQKQEEIYRIVLEANERAIKAVRAGTPCGEIDASARNFIAEKGYGDNFVHSIGHGVGLQIHEAPVLHQKPPGSLLPLKAGNVITIEPGIYIPDWGGMRIEDVVVVNEDGCEVLTASPKNELIVL